MRRKTARVKEVQAVVRGAARRHAIAAAVVGLLAVGTANLPAAGLQDPAATVQDPPEAVQNPAEATQDPPEAATADPAIPGASLTVHLLTVEPGDAVWELFGHNALLVTDTDTGYSQAFNYGLFDTYSSGFYLEFLKGRMMYRVGAFPRDPFIAAYRAQNRRVWAQELDLEPGQKAELLGLLQTAVLPENMRYRYEYYLNNCSTKLRDVLDIVLDGQLRRATDGSPTGTNWREQTRRLTAADPLGYLGIDLVLGPMGDEPTNRWQEMWIPMKLRDTVGALRVTRSDGSRVRLVRSEELWVASDRPLEAAAAPSVVLLFLLCGMLAGVFLLVVGRAASRGSRYGRAGLAFVGGLWGIFCFVAGTLLIGIHWTDHQFMYWNHNILLFSPLGAGVAFSLIRVASKGHTSTWGRRFAVAALGLAGIALVLNLIPGLASGNREMVVFTLPIHLAVCWVMLRVYGMEDALVYGPGGGPREARYA